MRPPRRSARLSRRSIGCASGSATRGPAISRLAGRGLAPAAAPTAYDQAVRVLLIDDDARLAELLVGYLAPQGVTLVHAPGGQAALSQLAGAPYDAVLLDVMMPGLDGLAVLRKIRDAGHH